jgi:hypothetical protein
VLAGPTLGPVTGDDPDRKLPEPADRRALRVSDADRNAVAERLGAAHAEGRLTIADYDDRVAAAYSAVTYGDLEELTLDLPAAVPVTKQPAVRDEARVQRRAEWTEWFDEWRSWAGAAVIMTGIWGATSLASGELTFYWPVFPLVIWAAVLLAGLVSGEDGEDGEDGEEHGKKRKKHRNGTE